MNLPQVFDYDNQQVRTVERNEIIWFVAADVCRILSMDATQVRRLDDDEKGLHLVQTLGGNQSMTVVNESGLYSLIMTSRKPEAKRFKKWVTSEVLPTIRKTGSYVIDSPQLQIANALVLANKMIEESKAAIALMAPKAAFFDAVTDSKDAVDIGTVAKVLNMGVGRTRLFDFLRAETILMKNNQPYQKYVDSGYFRIIGSSFQKPDGSTHISFKTVVFQKGIDFIRRRLADMKEAA